MLPSQIPIDEMFDLDAALTMDVDLPDNHQEREEEDDDESKAKAASRLLDELPTVEGGGRCAVCAEGLRLGGAAKQIPCGHVFHQHCILRWLSLIYSCPLCRQNCPPPGIISSD
ncbi:E3 ubiquitin-protein ligase SIRP1-like [Salvia miltiorrhiza]|uniref:E3 ubiquitin-protein ligase SIRP1-like n=1 Tax=Salvia miltiorrhiza TaxID=226208 RepID=UPI0025AC5030|nr:E3 ubiquitin-protein ligase SIRP1-like [Salvia miltiorrhiza]